jgi:hypothetical protein
LPGEGGSDHRQGDTCLLQDLFIRGGRTHGNTEQAGRTITLIYIHTYSSIYICIYANIYIYIYINVEIRSMRGEQLPYVYHSCILDVIISITVNFFGIYVLSM